MPLERGFYPLNRHLWITPRKILQTFVVSISISHPETRGVTTERANATNAQWPIPMVDKYTKRPPKLTQLEKRLSANNLFTFISHQQILFLCEFMYSLIRAQAHNYDSMAFSLRQISHSLNRTCQRNTSIQTSGNFVFSIQLFAAPL